MVTGSSPPCDLNDQDILSVRLYRGGIVLAAVAFVIGTMILLVTEAWLRPSAVEWLGQYGSFVHAAIWILILGTGISVLTIHLYIGQFHTLLKILLAIGVVSVAVFLGMGIISGRGFLSILYETWYGTFGFGFVLAALCGVAVKEAFCFGRAEAILFAVITPILILGHLFHALTPLTAFLLLCADTVFVCIFAVRKVIMPIDLDIGDKSIYQQKTGP